MPHFQRVKTIHPSIYLFYFDEVFDNGTITRKCCDRYWDSFWWCIHTWIFSLRERILCRDTKEERTYNSDLRSPLKNLFSSRKVQMSWNLENMLTLHRNSCNKIFSSISLRFEEIFIKWGPKIALFLADFSHSTQIECLGFLFSAKEHVKIRVTTELFF